MSGARKDDRLYARYAINMDEHPKIMLLSDAAFRALFEATFYSRRQLTDGFIQERIARRKWSDDVIIELTTNSVENPSWRIGEKDGVEGFFIHDFEKHQTTTADIEAKREAGRKGGEAKARNAAARTPRASTPLVPASTGVARASDVPDDEEAAAIRDFLDDPSVPASPNEQEALADGLANAGGTLAKTETETETKTTLPSEGGAGGPAPTTEKINARTRTAESFPEKFWITDGMKTWAADRAPGVDITEETRRFADHYRSTGGAKGRKKDWEATWRNWMTSEFTVGSAAYKAKLGAKVDAYRTERPTPPRNRVRAGDNPYAD